MTLVQGVELELQAAETIPLRVIVPAAGGRETRALVVPLLNEEPLLLYLAARNTTKRVLHLFVTVTVATFDQVGRPASNPLRAWLWDQPRPFPFTLLDSKHEKLIPFYVQRIGELPPGHRSRALFVLQERTDL